jgi:propionyl-CoA carboxylase alpha chain
MFYDPMIAKLITHAPTRAAAIDAQADALDAFYIDGIQHNVPFLSTVMQHPRWRAGNLSTGFIKEEFPDGFKPKTPEGKDLETLASVAAVIDHIGNSRRRGISHQMAGQSVRFAKRRSVKIGQKSVLLEVMGAYPGPYYVSLLDETGKPKKTMEITSEWWPGEPVFHGSVANEKVAVQVRSIPNGVNLSYRGIQEPSYVYTLRDSELAALVEAMKMANILKAERDGKVKKVNAKAGDSLAVDAVILEFA